MIDTGSATPELARATAPAIRPAAAGSRRRWRIALGLYVLALHAFVAVMLVHSNVVNVVQRKLGFDDTEELDRLHRHWSYAFDRQDKRARPGALLFVGDSMLRDLDTSSIARHTLNMAIPGDTTVGVLKRLAGYRSLQTARGVVLEVGLNDLKHRSVPETLGNFDRILGLTPEATPMIVVAILPVDERATALFRNQDIRRLNEGIATRCAARAGCVFVDPSERLRDASGDLLASAHEGDGIHLSASGHDVYWTAINNAVNAFMPPAQLSPPQR